MELDFTTEGYEGQPVARDFAFVEKDGKTLFVMPSGTDHKIAIVEITNGDMRDVEPTYITFNTAEFEKGRDPHGRFRRIEWVVGTNYVWVSDGSLEEVYIIDVMEKTVVNILKEVDPSALLSVQNYDKESQIEEQKAVVSSMMTDDDNSTIEIVAICIGSIAILVGLANFMYMVKMRKDFQTSTSKSEKKQMIGVGIGDELDSENGIHSVN